MTDYETDHVRQLVGIVAKAEAIIQEARADLLEIELQRKNTPRAVSHSKSARRGDPMTDSTGRIHGWLERN
jgi:hypothetical protein